MLTNVHIEPQAKPSAELASAHGMSSAVVTDILRRAGILEDLATVEYLLEQRSYSDSALLHEAGIYTVAAGGKRLRAALVLLAARLGNYNFPRASHPAIAIELLHAASLIHDDLVDHAGHRRGRVTVHSRWNPTVALMLGDFFFARAAYELVDETDPRIIRYYVDAAQTMVEGELSPVTLLQPLEHAREQYYHKIWAKTAVLFEAACKCGMAVADGSEENIVALANYGHYMGMAFQIVDDVLDFIGNERLLGKPAGNDLREGTLTLPLIYAVDMSDHPLLRDLAHQPRPRAQDINTIIDLVIRAGGHTRAMEDAQMYIARARSSLDHFALSPTHDALIELGDFFLQRQQ